MAGVKLCRACGRRPTPNNHHWYCGPCRRLVATKRELARTPVKRAKWNRVYGSAHQKLRKQFAALVDAGGVRCARCRGLIVPGEPWDLGHVDGDSSRYQGPEHRRCNRATAGRGRKVSYTSRRW